MTDTKKKKSIFKNVLFYGMILAGLAIIVLGLFCRPALFFELKRWGISIDKEMKVLSYQFYALTAGFLCIFVAFLFFQRKLIKFIIIPIFILYFVICNSVYLKKRYPGNILTNAKMLLSLPQKTFRVLLGQELFLSDYRPVSTLTVNSTKIDKAKFPVIDIHAHFYVDTPTVEETVDLMKTLMDDTGVVTLVDLNGLSIDNGYDYDKKDPHRFITFYPLWFPDGKAPEGHFEMLAGKIEEVVEKGAKGIKIWKNIGLRMKNPQGEVIPIDDPSIHPVGIRFKN